eukprot:m.561317 g.561317  ORF g.561317 m.561317 type:complete len:62 (+) comp22215_c0_seq12:1414-1599(+)
MVDLLCAGGDSGDACDYVVYDPKKMMVLMYSRIPGASLLCFNKHEHFIEGTADTISLKTID